MNLIAIYVHFCNHSQIQKYSMLLNLDNNYMTLLCNHTQKKLIA